MEDEEHESSMIEERNELMVPPNSGASPTLRHAHFLKPIISKPNLNQIHPKLLCSSSFSDCSFNMVAKMVKFRMKLKPMKHWNSWVESLLQNHQEKWKKVGIFDAIKGSTYHFGRDKELIIRLAEKWCTGTSSFVFSWGECSITLEDVMILGGFSVTGVSSRRLYGVTEGGEIQNKLDEVCKMMKKKYKLYQVSQTRWLHYFKGRGGELEHVAFLVLWLSRYVFTSNVYELISVNVFHIAVSLSKGTRIALAPVILASIYRDLRMLKEKLVTLECEGHQDDGSKLALWANLQLAQVWAWERFPTIDPKPISLASGEPRVARWHKIRKSESRVLRREIGSTGDDFLWRPYALHLKNWELPMFYCDQEKWVLLDSEVNEPLLSFARCLRACELVGIDCVEQYLPHRVAMQFALDQDIPSSIPRRSADYELAYSSYDKPFDGLKYYIPPRLSEGDVTLQYFEWWRTPLLLCDVVRRKRSTRKLKKVSEVLDADHKGNEIGEDMEIDLQVGLEDLDKCEDSVMREEVEREVNWRNINMVEGSKASERIHPQSEFHPTLSSPVCIEAMGSEFVGNGSDMLIDISSSCKDIPSHNYEYIVEKVVSCGLLNSLTGQEEDKEKLESNSMKEDKERDKNESCLNLGVRRKSSEGKPSPSGSHISLSSPTCNEVMGLDFVQSCSDLPNENSPSCKGRKPSETQEHDTNQNDLVNVMKPLIGVEENKGQFKGSYTGAEPLMEFVMITLSSVPVQDEQGEANEDAKAKQMNCSHVNLLIVSDEEDNIGVHDAFEAQCLAVNASLSRLEKRISSLQAR